MNNRTGASSDALLDRMADALRHRACFCDKGVCMRCKSLAEYDSLRAQSSVATEVAAAPVIKHVWSDSDQGWVIDIRAMGQVVLVEIDVKEVGVAVLHGPVFVAYEPKDQPQASSVAATGEPPKVTEAKAESGPVAPFGHVRSSESWTHSDPHDGSACLLIRKNPANNTRPLYAAPAAPERAEGQRVTDVLRRMPPFGPLLKSIAVFGVIGNFDGKPILDAIADAIGWCAELENEFDALNAAVREGETKPFETTSPCGDPDVTVMARDAETGEPTMFSRRTK